jgi:hypothetical protein
MELTAKQTDLIRQVYGSYHDPPLSPDDVREIAAAITSYAITLLEIDREIRESHDQAKDNNPAA